MNMSDEVKKEELFRKKLKSIQELSEKEKAAKMEVEMYYQGIEYANEGVPFEEIEHMGLSNEEAFMRGYNETLDSLGKSR